MSRDIHRAELPEEGIWTHIDSFFAESMDLTSESADGGLFSPKINGVDSMGGAESVDGADGVDGAAGTSYPSLGTQKDVDLSTEIGDISSRLNLNPLGALHVVRNEDDSAILGGCSQDAPIVIEDSECDVDSDDELRSSSDLLSWRFTMRKNSRAAEPGSDADMGDSDMSTAVGLVCMGNSPKGRSSKALLSDSAVIPDSLEDDEGATIAESAEKEVTPSLDYLFEDDLADSAVADRLADDMERNDQRKSIKSTFRDTEDGENGEDEQDIVKSNN